MGYNQYQQNRMTNDEKKRVLTKRVKEMLDTIGFEIVTITTTLQENTFHRNEQRVDMFATSFNDSMFNRLFIVYSDVETLEFQYVQTGPASFMDIDDFFEKNAS